MRKRNPIMLEEAQERLMKIKMKEETETVWVTEALGRVCAENIYAVMDQPPFPRSPLDGYAVRSLDTAGASRENPVRLNAQWFVNSEPSTRARTFKVSVETKK